MSSHKDISVRSITLVISLWLGGVGGLAGCAYVLTAVDHSAAVTNVCWLDVNEANQTSSAQETWIDSAANACLLVGQVCGLIKKPVSQFSAIPSVSVLASIQRPSTGDQSPSAHPIRISDRHETYLRNCAFLI